VTPAAPLTGRSRRLRAPLLVALWALLAFEAAGGLVIFFARLAAGTLPGESVHVYAGIALTFAYAAYQWGHWNRVAPFRARLDYALGLIAAIALALTQLTGFALAWPWWLARGGAAPASYAALLSGAHNVMSMFVLTFDGAHLGAVLQREARTRSAPAPD
jgi:hypothetical protein